MSFLQVCCLIGGERHATEGRRLVSATVNTRWAPRSMVLRVPCLRSASMKTRRTSSETASHDAIKTLPPTVPRIVPGLPQCHGTGSRGQQPAPPQGASDKTRGSISTSMPSSASPGIPPEPPAAYGPAIVPAAGASTGLEAAGAAGAANKYRSHAEHGITPSGERHNKEGL